MGGLGWSNPFPLEFGGDETRLERIYATLRSAVGKGGSAANDTGIDGLWRQTRANALAQLEAQAERAALQALPDHATDSLPYYERLLLLRADPAASDDERRAAAAQLYALQVASAIPDLSAALAQIDPRFEIIATSFEQSDTTIIGRGFEDYAATEPFGGGRHSTQLPNYSTELVLFVLFDLGGGNLPSPSERRSMQSALGVLNAALPAWNDIVLATHRGFELDVDRLDLTSFEL
jgi:hypothetical protein